MRASVFADMIHLHLGVVTGWAIVPRVAVVSGTGQKNVAARLVAPTCPGEAVPTYALLLAARVSPAGPVLILSSDPMPLRAWAEERPNVTSAREGTRVHKDSRHGHPVVFTAAVAHPIIASRKSVMSATPIHNGVIAN